MNKKAWAMGLTVGLLGAGVTAKAALLDAGNGLVNDTVLNICWVANAGLSNEQLGGGKNWEGMVSWAANLEYGGYDDWRLASVSVAGGVNPIGISDSVVDCSTATEAECRDNELGYMYTYYLPGNYGDDKTGDQTVGGVTLTDIQGLYWSATKTVSPPDGAWDFDFENGGQYDGDAVGLDFGWAVRSGQCRAAQAGAHPVPAVGVWGLGVLGLLLAGVARARLR